MLWNIVLFIEVMEMYKLKLKLQSREKSALVRSATTSLREAVNHDVTLPFL